MLTSSIPSQSFYTDTYQTFLKQHTVNAKKSKLLAYEMVRSKQENTINITAVIFA